MGGLPPDAPRSALAKVRALQRGDRPDTLPVGVEIELEEVALEHLEQSLRAGDGLRELLVSAFQELTTALGRRPTLTEVDRRGRYAPQAYVQRFGSWFDALRAMGVLANEESDLQIVCGEFLRELERTAMTRSFKMVVMKAMVAHRQLPGAVPLSELVTYFRTHFDQERYAADVAGTDIDEVSGVADDVLGQYIVRNPINAWIGGNTREPSRYFAYDPAGQMFRYVGPNPERTEAFLEAVSERVDWRLHGYMQRPGPARNLFKVIPTGEGGSACIMLGNSAGDGLPRGEGWRLVRINGHYLYAKFAKVAINLLRAMPDDTRGLPNLLIDELKKLFCDDRLLDFGRAYRVRITREAGEGCWVLEAG